MVQTKYKTSGSVKSVWPEKIPVANTFIGEEEAKAAYDVVKAGWLSMGKKVEQFEKNFANYVNAPEAIAVSNGTAALHAVLVALGIKDGDEVILPAWTWHSCFNAVVLAGALPVCAEIDESFNIDPNDIEKRLTPNTRAIMVAHM